MTLIIKKPFSEVVNEATIAADLTGVKALGINSQDQQVAIPMDNLNAGGGGGGDMLKTTYDPNLIGADAFSMGSMAETAAKKILSNDERIKLASVEDAAKDNQTDVEIETAYNNRVAIASQAEAEAGTVTASRRWTPERVKQAIAANASAATGTVPSYTDTATMFADRANQTLDALYFDIVDKSTYKLINAANTTLRTVYELIACPSIHREYADLTALYADQANQWKNQTYYVDGANSETQLFLVYQGTTAGNINDYKGGGKIQEPIEISLSDFTTDITEKAGAGFWRALWDCEISLPEGGMVVEAPTGSSVIFDLNKNGVSMMTASKIVIDAGAKSSHTSASQPVLTTTSVSKGDIISGDIDQKGSTLPGKGASITFITLR